MKILVTGGAGFIGSHLTLTLLDSGHEVVCVDSINDYYDQDLKKARLRQFENDITFYKVDISDLKSLEEVFKRHSFDKICHLAAQAGVRYSLENPFSYAYSNYVGMQNMLELGKRYKIPHIVFASSSSVYGSNTRLPFKEDDRVDTPMSIYAASKRSCELLASSYHHLFGLETTVLRFFTVYGPFGRPDMALFKFTKAMLNNETIDVYNSGRMKRDFTYVDDIVDGFVKALDKPMGFEIFNLGNGNPVHLLDFIHEIENILNREAKKRMMPLQIGDVPETYADVSKAKEMLSYKPKIAVREGVRRFISWYKGYFGL